MGRPYSRDLRERVVAAVEEDGVSRRKAAAHFAVGISTVINWVRRFRETGSVLPGKMGGHRPKAIAGQHGTWLLLRIKEKDFTLRGLVVELAERGLKGRLPDGVELCPCREAQLQKKPCSPANRIVRTWREGGSNGKSIRPGSIPSAWCSSMRPGPRPTWRRSGAGRRGARGSKPKFRTAIGRR